MPRHARPEGYSPRHRFSERGAFGPVIRGSRKVRGQFSVLHLAPGTPGLSRFGMALTRRNVPLAVMRNRLKRIGREVFRRHAVKAAGLDVVVMLRARLAPGGEPAFVAELSQLLDQAARQPARG